MSSTVTRERRKNAGSKMSSLLDAEENVDHFYDSIYGGFEEDDNDIEYDSNQSDSEDIVDSDFSIDENDEQLSDDQNCEENNKKFKTKLKFGFKQKPIQTKPKKTEIGIPLEVDVPSMEPIVSKQIKNSFGGMFSTEKFIQNKCKFDEEVDETDLNNNLKKKVESKHSPKELTQNELLEESLITEKINLKSLKDWQQMESERAHKTKLVKHSIKEPFIRYHSVSMPLIQEIDKNFTDETKLGQNLDESHNSGAKNYSRTFISFSDDQTYASLLKSLNPSLPKPSESAVCAVTEMPARYYDPISQMPYANSQAFDVLRAQYYDNLEIYGNTSNEEIKQWIDWRQNYSHKWKEWHQKHSTLDNTVRNEVEDELQVVQSEPLLPKVTPNRKVIRSGRKRKKFFAK